MFTCCHNLRVCIATSLHLTMWHYARHCILTCVLCSSIRGTALQGSWRSSRWRGRRGILSYYSYREVPTTQENLSSWDRGARKEITQQVLRMTQQQNIVRPRVAALHCVVRYHQIRSHPHQPSHGKLIPGWIRSLLSVVSPAVSPNYLLQIWTEDQACPCPACPGTPPRTPAGPDPWLVMTILTAVDQAVTYWMRTIMMRMKLFIM